MTKKKSKSNISFIVAGFLILNGVGNAFHASIAKDKSHAIAAIFFIAIGVALIVVARKTKKKRR